MTDDQIKHMVNRFLSWKLPESFNPDGGISFKKTFNEHTAHPMKHEPTGTNLFDYTQAESMARHMVEGMPTVGQADEVERLQSELGSVHAHLRHMRLITERLRGVRDAAKVLVTECSGDLPPALGTVARLEDALHSAWSIDQP